MIAPGNNKDRLGYYRVGDFKTYSKVEAIELHMQTGIHPHWYFNEPEFLAYDWTQEPQASLSELYARRAQQLRDTYDYVVIFYSGGADSTNIVDSFVNNGIPFDELLTFNYYELDPDPESFFNAEIVRVVLPRVQQLQQQGVRFRHRMVDLTQVAWKVLYDQHFIQNRMYYACHHFGSTHVTKSYIRETTPDYMRMIEQGKKVVFVHGSDKPRLYKENGRYCIKFLDIVDSAIAVRTQVLNREYEYDELFYWAPESVDIICKQGHILKNLFDRYNLYSQDTYYSDKLVPLPTIEQMFDNKFRNEDRLSHRNLLNSIIYPTWDVQTYSSGKPIPLITSPRDRMWNKDTFFRQQKDRIKHHLSNLDPYWINDPNDIELGLKLCISPAYFLE